MDTPVVIVPMPPRPCARETKARPQKLLERQRSCFRAHVASSVRDFLAQARLMVETRFYRGVLALTEAFVAEEERSFEEAASAAASIRGRPESGRPSRSAGKSVAHGRVFGLEITVL